MGVSSDIFVNGVEIYKLKAKDFDINADPICLGNFLRVFSVDNMKKTGLNQFQLIMIVLVLITY